MSDPSHPEPPTPDSLLEQVSLAVGHEERDVHARPIALAVLGLTAVIVAAFVLMQLLFNTFALMQSKDTAARSPLAGAYGLKEPPEPRLQTSPLSDLQELRARDAAALSTYAWVDRDAGVVRIPIARAIEVLAARGLPARPAVPPAAAKEQP